ncbi:ethionine resistance protein [Coemansia guatemalensis]|uniref:Ethionine resistance protein n=1 Tax=Coemansia guatemalensis TaxID=2761395 RepID=A0A9W8HWE9_9FUNG|nr:ethionine resistance protein [Coemansia guatemalensis]
MTSLLLAIGQEPRVAELSGMYMRAQIFGVLPWSVFEACKRYLQSQGIMRAGALVLLVVLPIHILNNYLLVYSPTFGIGFVGAAIATIISEWLMVAGMIIYVLNSRAMETWGGWDFRALRNMSTFYRLALPAVIMMCAEWITFELLSIGASYFGPTQLVASAVMINTHVQVVHINNGIGFGTSPRIGNLIGAAKPRLAHITSCVAIATSSFVGIMCTLFLAVFGDWWISVYTSDPAVVPEVRKIITISYIFTTFNGLNAVLGAIMRGLGRQKTSAAIHLLGYHLCAIPLGAYLGFGLKMQVSGLWWGVCAGILVVFVSQVVYIYKLVNWKDEVRLCMARLRQSRANSDENQEHE